MKCRVLRADVDQVAAYARDLQEYHFESRNRKVTPLLVVTRMKHTLESRGSVLVTSGDCLQEALLDTLREDTTACDAAAWMSSRYEPLPTIVETAQRIMRKEALPHIRSADSAGIPRALQAYWYCYLCAQEGQAYARLCHGCAWRRENLLGSTVCL